jgi:hypothetical protein
MPRSMSTDTRWLEKHGGQWRVTVAVPGALHKTLGTRLKRPLHTDSLAVANRLKFQAIAELRARIEQARELAGGKPRAIIREAIEIAEYRKRATTPDEHQILDEAIVERTHDILGVEIRTAVDEATGES